MLNWTPRMVVMHRKAKDIKTLTLKASGDRCGGPMYLGHYQKIVTKIIDEMLEEEMDEMKDLTKEWTEKKASMDIQAWYVCYSFFVPLCVN